VGAVKDPFPTHGARRGCVSSGGPECPLTPRDNPTNLTGAPARKSARLERGLPASQRKRSLARRQFRRRRPIPRGQGPEGFAELAPDLAVEILSPEDRPREVLDKVGEYLQAGVRLVWVIDPGKGEASVYRSLTDVRVVGSGAALDGEDVLPGFRCPLGEILV